MESDRQLSLEQEFDLRVFSEQVKEMTLEQAQECLLKLHKSMLIRENMYREILKNAWGIGQDPFASSDPFYA